MKVAIINSPINSPFAPPISIISLKSYLERKGISVFQIDASIEVLHYLLSPEKLKENFSQSLDILQNNEDIAATIFSHAVKDYIAHVVPVEEFKKTIKKVWRVDGFGINKQNFEDQILTLHDALLFSCARYFPTILTTSFCLADFHLLHNRERDPFADYYQNMLIPNIQQFQPDLIGISFSSWQQLFPGLSLIAELRKHTKIKIVIGGALVTMLCKKFCQNSQMTVDRSEIEPVFLSTFNALFALLFLADYGIQGEGEGPLMELCQRLENHQSCLDIPNLVYQKKDTKSIVFNLTCTISI